MTGPAGVGPRPTVFLDRDGVINHPADEGAYIESWAAFRFLPGAVDALRRLSELGYRLVVVTNQRGVARGRMSQDAVDDIHARMRTELRRAGIRLDGVFVCPHEAGTCICRKPDVGLFHRAQAADPAISFERSSVVGDSVSDVDAANRIGARAYLVGPMAATRAATARERGLRVEAHAASLLALVDAGVFEVPSPALAPASVAR